MNACGPPTPLPLGPEVLGASSSASDIGPQQGRRRGPGPSASVAVQSSMMGGHLRVPEEEGGRPRRCVRCNHCAGALDSRDSTGALTLYVYGVLNQP